MLRIVKEVLKEELDRIIHMQEKYLQEYEKGLHGLIINEDDQAVYAIRQINKQQIKIYIGQEDEVDLPSLQKELEETEQYRKSYLQLLEDEKKLRKAIDCL